MPPFPAMINNTLIIILIIDMILLPSTQKICKYYYNKEDKDNYCQNANYDRHVPL